MKRCWVCKEYKAMTPDNYYNSASACDGFGNTCKPCATAKQLKYIKTPAGKAYKKKQRIVHAAQDRARQERNKPLRRAQETERRRTDVHFNIKNRMRYLIFSSLKRGKGGKKWSTLLDYSPGDLKTHLEKRFTKGMTWKRFLNGEIHIDHEIPVSAFNFTTEYDIDFRRCWAISNLQPMWAEANISKSNKLSAPFQPALGLAISA
jgi:uncharacterized protein (DUF2249 family)